MANKWRVTLCNRHTMWCFSANGRTMREAFNRVVKLYQKEICYGFSKKHPDMDVIKVWQDAFYWAEKSFQPDSIVLQYPFRSHMLVVIKRI